MSKMWLWVLESKESDLEAYLDNAWAVHDAPQRALAATATRVEKLQSAARDACVCSGVVAPGLKAVLEWQNESVSIFCTDVLQALHLGAARGVNMGIVGPPGCGKSTVFESLACVFKVCGKPQRDCSFAFADVPGADILLWQEFTWTEKTCAWEDLLNVLVGEGFGIRLPCAKPVTLRNDAPMFYTAWSPLRFRSPDLERMLALNRAMDERFKLRTWARPLPQENRMPKFPKCGCCFAKFVLENAAPERL